jgi:hypothetical protein
VQEEERRSRKTISTESLRMSKAIHELSQAIVLPEFDVFGVPGTQAMVERDIVTEHRPIASLDGSLSAQYEIYSPDDQYIRFDESELYVRMTITPPTLGEADKDCKVFAVNNFMNSLIKQLDVSIDDVPITSATQAHSYQSYFDTSFGYSKGAKNSHLSAAGWVDDEDCKLTLANALINAKIREGKEIDLMGKLSIDLAEQERALIGGSKVSIKLHFNDPKFYLRWLDKESKATEGDKFNPTVTFKEATIFLHRSKVYSNLVEAQKKALTLGSAKYPITFTKIKPFTLNRGINDAVIDNIVSGDLPRRIKVALVDNVAYNGSYKHNPFYFEDFNLNHLKAVYNGYPYQSRPFNPDFKNDRYIREMMSLFKAHNQDGCDSTIPINRGNYTLGNVVYAFNFAPDLSTGCVQGYANPIQQGTLRLELGFAEALPQTVTLLVYMEFDKIIEIDQDKNVTLS